MKEEGLTGLYYDYALAAPVMAGMNEKSGQPGHDPGPLGPVPLPITAAGISRKPGIQGAGDR